MRYQHDPRNRRIGEGHTIMKWLQNALKSITITRAAAGGTSMYVGDTDNDDDFPDNFLDLIDTPSSYVGQEGKLVAVNSSPNALEFITLVDTVLLCFPCSFDEHSTDAEDTLVLPNWKSGAWPLTAVAVTVTSTKQCSFTLPIATGNGVLDDSYARFQWTSTRDGETIATGSQLVLGFPFYKYKNTITVKARVRVNETDRLDSIYLAINDTDSPVNESVTTNQIGSLTDNVWTWLTLSNIDVSSWENELRVTVTIQGTTDPDNVGAIDFDIEQVLVTMS